MIKLDSLKTYDPPIIVGLPTREGTLYNADTESDRRVISGLAAIGSGNRGIELHCGMPWRRLPPPEEVTDPSTSIKVKRSRFRLDEDVASEVGDFLRSEGFRVTGSADLKGHEDEDQLAEAWRNGEVLITHDKGFLDERRHPEHRNPGIIVIEGGHGNSEHLITALYVVINFIGPYDEIMPGTTIHVNGAGVITARLRNVNTGKRETYKYRFHNGDWQQWSSK